MQTKFHSCKVTENDKKYFKNSESKSFHWIVSCLNEQLFKKFHENSSSFSNPAIKTD